MSSFPPFDDPVLGTITATEDGNLQFDAGPIHGRQVPATYVIKDGPPTDDQWAAVRACILLIRDYESAVRLRARQRFVGQTPSRHLWLQDIIFFGDGVATLFYDAGGGAVGIKLDPTGRFVSEPSWIADDQDDKDDY